MNKIKRFLRFLFVKRLAIYPYPQEGGKKIKKDIKIFEWQRMPKGYRWF